jgi:hypothetical protein
MFADGQCYYRGKSYSTGESWYDGCDYECTCEDGASGRYRCYNRYAASISQFGSNHFDQQNDLYVQHINTYLWSTHQQTLMFNKQQIDRNVWSRNQQMFCYFTSRMEKLIVAQVERLLWSKRESYPLSFDVVHRLCPPWLGLGFDCRWSLILYSYTLFLNTFYTFLPLFYSFQSRLSYKTAKHVLKKKY